MRTLRSRQRGNSLVEFAIASAILIPCMSGVFGYGYTFYTYNLLESSVANGARYAAFRTYRCMSSSDIDKGKLAIKNMILKGVEVAKTQLNTHIEQAIAEAAKRLSPAPSA